MCGFAGFAEFSEPFSSREDLLAMQNAIRHRGPDDQGYFFETGIGLCHARLAVIDLTKNAYQPMRRNDLTVVYNGEIYNYQEIREELIRLGHSFESSSDTEVLLHAYRQWGKEILTRLNGMFAFAIYDHKKKTLFLARDKVGIKPLFYYYDSRRFIFGSEIKTMTAYPHFRKRLSDVALKNYLLFGYTTGKETIWQDCCRLLPGHYMEVDAVQRSVRVYPYWDPHFDTQNSESACSVPDFNSAVKELKSVLIEEFHRSMVSDVPVGVCISGGVDSNVLISILTKELKYKLKTYSLGSRMAQYDENASANAVARFLKTDHTSIMLDPMSSRDLFLDTICHYDEPVADQNTLSFRLIARSAKEDGVRVLLSGNGGDELFLGYGNVFLRNRLPPFFHIPQRLRCALPISMCRFSNKLYKGVHLLQQKNYITAMACIVGNYFYADEIRKLVRQQDDRGVFLNHFQSLFASQFSRMTMIEKIIRGDILNYLPDNVLNISDVSTMAEGVEMRVPFLNNNILAFSLKTPKMLMCYRGKLKALLRAIEREYLPESLTLKKKQGFYPFIKDRWLDFYMDLRREYLSPGRFARQNLFDFNVFQEIVSLQNTSRVNISNKIWNMFIFQIWAENHL